MDAFQPGNFESRWYRFWESNRYFSPDHPLQKEREKVFTIIISPPQCNGVAACGARTGEYPAGCHDPLETDVGIQDPLAALAGLGSLRSQKAHRGDVQEPPNWLLAQYYRFPIHSRAEKTATPGERSARQTGLRSLPYRFPVGYRTCSSIG